MNAIAVALFVEAIMVLASILSKQQREQGRAEGIAEGRAEGIAEGRTEGIVEGITEERKRSNAKLRAWAKKKGIPLEELPLDDDENVE